MLLSRTWCEQNRAVSEAPVSVSRSGTDEIVPLGSSSSGHRRIGARETPCLLQALIRNVEDEQFQTLDTGFLVATTYPSRGAHSSRSTTSTFGNTTQ